MTQRCISAEYKLGHLQQYENQQKLGNSEPLSDGHNLKWWICFLLSLNRAKNVGKNTINLTLFDSRCLTLQLLYQLHKWDKLICSHGVNEKQSGAPQNDHNLKTNKYSKIWILAYSKNMVVNISFNRIGNEV